MLYINQFFKKVLVLIFISPLVFHGQELIEDTFKYKATYKQTAYLDSTDVDFVKIEEMHLLVGKQTSMFASAAMSMQRSLKINRGNSGHTPRAAVTEFPYVIIKDIKKNKKYYTHKIVDDNFYYEENPDDLKWEIHSETKKYKNYNCVKATTNWRGRKYIAWFTKKIPVSDGPYKFNGLPGLIVELYDTKKHYQFELQGFEKLKKPLKVNIKWSDYIKIGKEKLMETFLTYKKDPMTYAYSPTRRMSPEVHKAYVKSFTEMVKKRNNHIELE
ncbi:GLPGLI family protein [Cellulophaga lytica]|nr:GLPGLI family protein [Cellulophaga lytica]